MASCIDWLSSARVTRPFVLAFTVCICHLGGGQRGLKLSAAMRAWEDFTMRLVSDSVDGPWARLVGGRRVPEV